MRKVIATFILTDEQLNNFINNQNTDFIRRTVFMLRDFENHLLGKLFIIVLRDDDLELIFLLEDFAKIIKTDIVEFY